MIPVTIVEIQSILSVSKNDKSPRPDGIPVEVYRALFYVLGRDLLRFVEDSRINGKIPAVFNSTFIALIPKTDTPKSFDDFIPISLCNFIYKIIGKIISTRIKKILGRIISKEQFGYLPGRQIHEAVGIIQECLHSIHVKAMKSVVLKIDLFKAYDRVNWIFLWVIMTKMRFSVSFITWVMSSITSVSFVVLINGVASNFFRSGRGLR